MEYEIREYQPEDESAVLALIEDGLGTGPAGKRDRSFWQWKHTNNPFGHSISLVATDHTGNIIGLRTFMRWRFNAANTVINAVRAVDTVTHPEYRRYGIFSALTRHAMERVKNNGIDIIFNTPNNQVLPGYLKLGWEYISHIKPMIKILNYRRFITQMLKSSNRQLNSSGQIPPEEIFRQRLPLVGELLNGSNSLEQLLQYNKKTRFNHIYTDKSPEYIKWRYSDYPYNDYAVIYQKNNSELSGCIIFKPNTRYGLKEVVLNELILSKPDDILASHFLRVMKRCVSADYIIAYFPHDSFERHMLRKNGFLKIPKGGMNFIVNMISSQLPLNPTRSECWDLSMGDLEVF